MLGLYRDARTFARALSARFGLTTTEFTVLKALGEGSSFSHRELAERARITASNLTSVISALEERGVVGRERSKTDRRVVAVSLTADGRALTEKLPPTPTEMLSEAIERLSPTDQHSLGKIMRHINDTVDEFRNKLAALAGQAKP